MFCLQLKVALDEGWGVWTVVGSTVDGNPLLQTWGPCRSLQSLNFLVGEIGSLQNVFRSETNILAVVLKRTPSRETGYRDLHKR